MPCAMPAEYVTQYVSVLFPVGRVGQGYLNRVSALGAGEGGGAVGAVTHVGGSEQFPRLDADGVAYLPDGGLGRVLQHFVEILFCDAHLLRNVFLQDAFFFQQFFYFHDDVF